MNRKVTFKVRYDEFDKFILAAAQEIEHGMRATSIKLIDFALSDSCRAPYFIEVSMESENYENKTIK